MPESLLSNDEIQSLTKTVIESVISNNESYKHSDVSAWNDSIVEQIVQRMLQHNSSYKYIVHCTIVQKNGAGISNTSTCYWNKQQDRYINVRWENKHLHCVVAIYIVSY